MKTKRVKVYKKNKSRYRRRRTNRYKKRRIYKRKRSRRRSHRRRRRRLSGGNKNVLGLDRVIPISKIGIPVGGVNIPVQSTPLYQHNQVVGGGSKLPLVSEFNTAKSMVGNSIHNLARASFGESTIQSPNPTSGHFQHEGGTSIGVGESSSNLNNAFSSSEATVGAF